MLKERLNQFILNTQSQFIEVSDRSNAYQCLDLAYLWIFALGFPKGTIQNLYAYQVYTAPKEITKKYFDIIPNTPDFVPQDGDIAVFDKSSTNSAGHIGIALGGGNTSSFMCFEQNWPIGTNASVRSRNYNTPKLLGVLRPKIVSEELVLTDQTLLPIIDSNGKKMELQAVRSTISDQERQITNLLTDIDNLTFTVTALNIKITELQTKLDNTHTIIIPAPEYSSGASTVESSKLNSFQKMIEWFKKLLEL